MGRKLQDMSMVRGCIALSSRNEAEIALINALKDGEDTATMWDETQYVADFHNHGDNRDPATGGGVAPGDVKIDVYYAPANDKEYANKRHDTIGGQGYCSGRRRICMRVQSGRCGGDDLVSFYMTSHPAKYDPKVGKNNSYTQYTPIDTTK
jgi:hypothetical protein